ncbi:uncharacterized protein EI90DRAFT_3046890 [Cantharellus anzutake]|uniref:uncharacterized protein n=1 Tax=Cantharellus anzutake TaxID=1750568 RepID=UPI0019060E71|nr:uncharacterized protein EI90DRAFT_3046890 [Cantharellus anzutake]KAF8335718.1 hypothetical protein EI90DRAFT_3046890 [Cantharellus anzutake]
MGARRPRGREGISQMKARTMSALTRFPSKTGFPFGHRGDSEARLRPVTNSKQLPPRKLGHLLRCQ